MKNNPAIYANYVVTYDENHYRQMEKLLAKQMFLVLSDDLTENLTATEFNNGSKPLWRGHAGIDPFHTEHLLAADLPVLHGTPHLGLALVYALKHRKNPDDCNPIPKGFGVVSRFSHSHEQKYFCPFVDERTSDYFFTEFDYPAKAKISDTDLANDPYGHYETVLTTDNSYRGSYVVQWLGSAEELSALCYYDVEHDLTGKVAIVPLTNILIAQMKKRFSTLIRDLNMILI